ncbi:hypothetical protein NIES4071_11090 [Calothrix sp. NIES-4071]|nr:hypothetical protein NIES4071_11090 [Calothrix sp. NIES-4071]BAZ55449.1 hypothetical protein NIES4105_11050 [Calothrix sp. NIES-4105]
MNQRREERLQIPALGEFYDDLLDIDAELSSRTRVQQAQSLLSEKLNERVPDIKQRVKYLADKRGVTSDQIWSEILAKRGKETAFSEGAIVDKPLDGA